VPIKDETRVVGATGGLIRAFLALEIPGPTRRQFAQEIEEWRPKLPGVRWLTPDTIHLTFRFLGDSPAELLESLHPLLMAQASTCPVTTVRVGGLGVFPERGHPRVLWVGAPLGEELLRLQRACEEAAVQCRWARETQTFRPHITLGRWREKVPRPVLPPVGLGEVEFRSLVLYQSELNPRGAIHTRLATFPFRGGESL